MPQNQQPKQEKRERFICIKEGHCSRCGDCCRRHPSDISPEEEAFLRRDIYEKKGIIYLYPFRTFGIPFKPYELPRFRKMANERGLDFDFKPLKIIIQNGTPVIIDYFLDMDACPFLSNNQCTVYEDRFEICKAFPDRTAFRNEFSFDHDQKWSYDEAYALAMTLASAKDLAIAPITDEMTTPQDNKHL